MRYAVRALIAIWFLLIFLLALNHGFISPSGAPPLAVGIAFIAPLLLFLAAIQLALPFAPMSCRSVPSSSRRFTDGDSSASASSWPTANISCPLALPGRQAWEISPLQSSPHGSSCDWRRTKTLSATHSSPPGTSSASPTFSLQWSWDRSTRAFSPAFTPPSPARSYSGCPSFLSRVSLSLGCSSRTSSC